MVAHGVSRGNGAVVTALAPNGGVRMVSDAGTPLARNGMPSILCTKNQEITSTLPVALAELLRPLRGLPAIFGRFPRAPKRNPHTSHKDTNRSIMIISTIMVGG